MDTVYQAVKNLLKSIVNLFVAVVELFSGFINGIASLLLKLRPQMAENRNRETKENGTELSGDGHTKCYIPDIHKQDTELVCAIREELKDKITDRDTYIAVKAKTEILDKSRMKRFFTGRKKLLVHEIVKQLLEEEYQDAFLNTAKPGDTEEKPKIQSICEMNKEAIS